MNKAVNDGSAINIVIVGTIEDLERAIRPSSKDWCPARAKAYINDVIKSGDLRRLLEALEVCAKSNKCVNRLSATDEDGGVTAEIWGKLFPEYSGKIIEAANDVDLDGISDPQAILEKIRESYWPCGVFTIMAEAVKATIDEEAGSEPTDATEG